MWQASKFLYEISHSKYLLSIFFLNYPISVQFNRCPDLELVVPTVRTGEMEYKYDSLTIVVVYRLYCMYVSMLVCQIRLICISYNKVILSYSKIVHLKSVSILKYAVTCHE